MGKVSKLHWSLLGMVIIGFIWSAIGPKDRTTWWLEIAPVLIALPILGFTYNRFQLTHLLYILIAIHAWILMIGGHYTYADVPAFNVLKEWMGSSRNGYDGVGHFAQGFIPAMIARELLLRKTHIGKGVWLSVAIILSCLGISAIYEIIEWTSAVILGQGADEFLGSQGDMWDTQKDMAWAGVGALCALLSLSKIHDRQLKSVEKR